MAGAKERKTQVEKRPIAFAKAENESQLIVFLNIRPGYLPGEQALLTYTLSRNQYNVAPDDFIALYKCGTKTASDQNLYKWPISTKCYGAVHKIKLGLPNPDRRLKSNEYQFVYVSYEQNKVVGRSRTFKISDIVEIEPELLAGSIAELDTTLDVSNKVDRELFKLKVTNPLSVKLYDVNRESVVRQSVAAVQADPHAELSTELRNALNSEVSTENILRVAELIQQYEQTYGRGQSVRHQLNTLPKQPKQTTVTQQTKMGKVLHQVEKNDHRSEVGTYNNVEVDVEDADVLFLKRFVFPYISGVLEHLSHLGFSRIVCRNGQVVLLNNNDGKALDLRRGWHTLGSTEMKQLARSSGIDIDELANKFEQLTDEVESLKQKSNNRHNQYMRELEKVKRQINQQCNGNSWDDNETVAQLKETNRALLTRIEVLKQRLDDKTEEYEMLSKLFVSQACCLQHNDSVELLRKNVPNWKRAKMGKRRVSTNTNIVHKKEEAVATECNTSSKQTATTPFAHRPPLVQKATSYAASTTTNDAMTSKEKKQTTTSDRALTTSLTNDQRSFIKLLQKLLNSEQTDKRLEAPPVTESESTESLAVAFRRLFNMCSSPSLASTTTSWHTTKSDDSVIEAVRSLFTTESSTATLPKTNSYPATPCNSADNLTRHKLPEEVKQSSSMKEGLKKLLNVNEERKAIEAPSCESDSSLWSLGEAMIKAFREDLSCTDIEEKSTLSTSNESLSQAMHWLFDTLSQHSLDKASDADVSKPADNASDADVSKPADSELSSSSLWSVLLWGLTDSTPDMYKGIDVKAVNQEKESRRRHDIPGTAVNCECHNKNIDTDVQKKNPSLSSVIRTSSPDRGVNISFPANSNQHKALIPPRLFPNHSFSQAKEANALVPEAAKTADTDLSSLVSGLSTPVPDKSTLDGHIKQAFGSRASRPRRIARRRTKLSCPHCNIVIQSRSIGQTTFRMSRHVRVHHKHDDTDSR